jgi:large subunit ribosomal protein L9
MQVILLRDIPKVGRKFDVVEVSDGYAANMLLPKLFAERATPGKIAELAKRKEASKVVEDARHAELEEKLSSLKDTPLTIVVKADEQGHLYKKIHAHDIASALKDEHGVHLDEESVLLESPIHELGDHVVAIEASGIHSTVTVSVIAE